MFLFGKTLYLCADIIKYNNVMTANDNMKRKYVKPARTATMRRAAMMLAAVVMTLAAQTARAQTEVSTWAELKTEL